MNATHTHEAALDASPSTVLLVPMHIDALYVSTGGTSVRQALADYSKLPYVYYDSGSGSWTTPITGQVPNLSDTILSPPCSGASMNLRLGAGIHLHWALPEGLTHSAEQDADGAHLFPVVPNRWLVTRRRDTAIEGQWVIESDYLAPDMTWLPPAPFPADSAPVPFPFADVEKGPYQPFRFMGRKVGAEGWSPVDPTGPDYLGHYGLALTATGVLERVPTLDHVKATFAAFYPNCQGVFGLHDGDNSVLDDVSGVTYEVLGWYADPTQDCSGIFYDHSTHQADSEQLMADFADRFGWTFEPGGAAFPRRTVLYGRITFKNGVQENPAATNPKIELSIGNSPTEAFSAYLAQSMDGDLGNKVIFEEQLEAIQVADRLNQRAVDLDAAFQEARHTKGFTPRAGGTLWSVLLADPTASADEVTLPDDLGHGLSQLNELQRTYDGAIDTIASLGERLFSDFCAWMVINYYQSADDLNGPDDLCSDPASLYAAVDRGALAPLRKYMTDTGRLALQVDPGTGTATATAAEVVIRLVSEENTFFQQVLQDLSGAQLTDANIPKDLSTHFADCGIVLSSSATITGTSSPWTVSDAGVNYLIVQNGGFLELHIPPFASQTSSKLASALASFCGQLQHEAPQYVLKPTAAPRYWQPNDPVALMVGPSVIATERFGTGDSLACTLLPGSPVADTDLLDLPGDSNGILSRIQAAVDALGQKPGPVGFASWTEQPWNPFMLEWNVQYFPNPRSGSYDPDAITGSYELPATGCDLSPQRSVQFTADAQEYAGFSILTPHASDEMRQQLAGYLAAMYDSLPAPYGGDLGDMTVEAAQAYLDGCIVDLQSAYDAAHSPPDPKDPIRTAIVAYALVKSKPCLSQALGGFNEALLAMKRTMQLDVSDPYVTPPDGDEPDSMLLATGVSGLVGDTLLRSREPLNPFSPIRSGKLKIAGLHLVDSFGRLNNLTFDAPTVTELMPLQEDGSLLLLPRLAQPARMLFRWLSAAPVDGQDDEEMNAHPATSPVCGWVLPNNLDSSLMVYEASGAMLGLVDEAGRWMPAPGAAEPVAVGDIENPHLRQLVQYLTSAGDQGEFMSAFLSAVDNALETIDPENFAQHEGLALLMGRPVALVRAAVSLEVQGLPARDNSWDVIAETVKQYQDDPGSIDKITGNPDRFTSAFDKVLLPVRIGEPGQLNDGLVGYWLEDGMGNYSGGAFYAPGGGDATYQSGSGLSVVTTPTNLQQSLDASASIMTMLVDPRGVVHATSGVLPAKAISIPPDQFADALKHIDITFLIAPILATGTEYSAPDGSRKLPLPLPQESSYTWSWLTQERGTWSETTSFSAVDTSARFSGQQWICEGWAKLDPNK